MIRPLLWSILQYYVFAATHSSRLDEKREVVIRHVPSKPIDSSIRNNIQISNSHRLLSKYNRTRETGQRIVILAGPHKTGSSSIQNNMYRWTSIDPQVLPSWSWPVPHEVLEFCEEDAKANGKRPLKHAKGFYPLGEAINVGVSNNHRPIFQRYSKRKVIRFYRNAIEKQWRDGYDIVIGTEKLDFLVIHDDTNVDKFLSILPLKKKKDGDNGVDYWGADKKDVTIVVTFRAPRVTHLISIFHQCCAIEMTFVEFLATLSEVKQRVKFHSLASLELSEIFLKRGFNVVLMDMGGIIHSGDDISNVVACEILKANCTEEEELISVEKVSPVTKNVKKSRGNMGVITDVQLEDIDKTLRQYDCNSKHVLEYDNLTILYNYELDRIMSECSKMKEGDRILNLHELATKIQSIVSVANDTDGEYYSNADIHES